MRLLVLLLPFALAVAPVAPTAAPAAPAAAPAAPAAPTAPSVAPPAAPGAPMGGTSPITAVIHLPHAVQGLADAGVPEADIAAVLAAAEAGGVSALDTAQVMLTETEAVKAHGPDANFGAFVQARIAEGLRGPALAASIAAAHGKDKAPGVGGPPPGKGPPEDRGRPERTPPERPDRAAHDAAKPDHEHGAGGTGHNRGETTGTKSGGNNSGGAATGGNHSGGTKSGGGKKPEGQGSGKNRRWENN